MVRCADATFPDVDHYAAPSALMSSRDGRALLVGVTPNLTEESAGRIARFDCSPD